MKSTPIQPPGTAFLTTVVAVGIRSYIAEPDRGRRDWSEAPDAQAPVYGNRRHALKRVLNWWLQRTRHASIGAGTPRGLQGRLAAVLATL